MLVRDLEQQAEAFADSTDDALNDPKQTLTGHRKDAASLGIALYVFETDGGDRGEERSRSSPAKRASVRGTGGTGGKKRPAR
jgi:hypothetical protein